LRYTGLVAQYATNIREREIERIEIEIRDERDY